jgi:hypothetical protein
MGEMMPALLEIMALVSLLGKLFPSKADFK